MSRTGLLALSVSLILSLSSPSTEQSSSMRLDRSYQLSSQALNSVSSSAFLCLFHDFLLSIPSLSCPASQHLGQYSSCLLPACFLLCFPDMLPKDNSHHLIAWMKFSIATYYLHNKVVTWVCSWYSLSSLSHLTSHRFSSQALHFYSSNFTTFPTFALQFPHDCNCLLSSWSHKIVPAESCLFLSLLASHCTCR